MQHCTRGSSSVVSPKNANIAIFQHMSFFCFIMCAGAKIMGLISTLETLNVSSRGEVEQWDYYNDENLIILYSVITNNSTKLKLQL